MAKILIIEDEKNLARFVQLELQHENYETVIENNGRKGLDEALNQNFDAILLDLMLPDLNGLEIARHLIKFFWLHSFKHITKCILNRL